MKITDYTILTCSGIEQHQEFMQKVREWVTEGWEPSGAAQYGPLGEIIQTMVKVDRSDEELIAEQINDIHTSLVVDLPSFFQNWRDHQNYPRAVTVQK